MKVHPINCLSYAILLPPNIVFPLIKPFPQGSGRVHADKRKVSAG